MFPGDSSWCQVDNKLKNDKHNIIKHKNIISIHLIVLDMCLQARIYLYATLLIDLVDLLKETLRLLVALVLCFLSQ